MSKKKQIKNSEVNGAFDKLNEAALETRKKSKKFLDDFKDFALKGNAVNLAVGVIIGAAFQSIVNSIVNDVISPIIGLFADTDFSSWEWVLKENADGTKVTLKYGSFITAVINFFIMALIIFLIVRFLTRLSKIGTKKEEVAEEKTTKTCPFCFSEINIKSTRCPDCTSILPENDDGQSVE